MQIIIIVENSIILRLILFAEDLRELEDLKFKMTPFKEMLELSASRRAAQYTVVPVIRRQEGGRELWQHAPPRVQIEGLYYAYPGMSSMQQHSLYNISLTIPAGGYCLGIVGPSGSGKSTFFRVLLGLEPLESGASNSGKIFLDGVDVTYCDRVPCFSMVGQENDLFRSLTLVDNIRYGTSRQQQLPDAHSYAENERNALLNACKDAQLEPLLSRVQGGLNAAVGPRGRLLSGGERQRVCLARALYREELVGGILLLDEITAALDPKTEDLVIRALNSRVEKGSTAILIAHRLSTVQKCDNIIVLKDGQILQQGSHGTLIKAGGWYADSWKVQQQQKLK